MWDLRRCGVGGVEGFACEGRGPLGLGEAGGGLGDLMMVRLLDG